MERNRFALITREISKLSEQFVQRLHEGSVSFIAEHFERTCDEMEERDWKGIRLVADNGDTVCDNQDYYPAETDPEHVRRILACLRYCHGIPTSDLEKQSALLGTDR